MLVGEGAASRLGATSQSVQSGDVARSLQEEPGEVVEQETVGRSDASLCNECMDTGDEGACRVAAAEAQAQMEVQAPDASLDSADSMGELPRSHRALHCRLRTLPIDALCFMSPRAFVCDCCLIYRSQVWLHLRR